jgi:hypothetical protein
VIRALALALVVVAGPVWAGDLPNPALTPGATRPLTLEQVCSTKWGRDARAVTLAMKKQVAAAYGIPWEQHSLYEFDHLVSRELSGSDEVANIWPQPWAGEWGAKRKDRYENALHRAVCRGEMSLKDAQDEIRTDWIAGYKRIFGE